MARVAFQRIVLCLAATGWLSGCVEGTATAPAGSTGTAPQVPAPAKSGKAGEVEAPDVFQTTDNALWDGRPSLGGIWVASPEAVDPERVVMVNVATGKTVAGALFRRERDNPGPTLQVSSDAADALGMLAGQPTELRVTALRKVEKQAPADVAPVAVAPVTDVAADTADGDAAAGETAALAAAALAATGTDAKVEADTDAKTGTVADAGAVVAGAVAADAATDAAPAKPKTWKERRAEAKAKRAADKAAAAAAATADKATAVAAEGAASTAKSAGVAAVETAPLDARNPDVAAAAEAATDAPPAKPVKKTRKEIKAEEKAAKEAAAAAPVAQADADADADAAVAAPAGRPIQVASFSKEENANRAVEALAKIGVTATPQKSEKAGTTVWGVVATGDDALLKSIKGAGFADAYFLK